MMNLVGGANSVLPGSVLSIFYDIGIVMLAVLIVLDLIYKPLSRKSVVFIGILILLSTVLATTSKRFDIFLMALLAIAFRNIDFDEFVTRDLLIRIFITIWMLIKYFNSVEFDIDSIFAARQDFGFGHPNSFGMMLTMVSLELMLVTRKNKIRFISYIVSITLLVANYYTCKSRTSLIILAAGITCFVLMDLKVNLLKLKFFQFLSRNLFLILLAISFSLVFAYEGGTGLGLKLDTIFSTRLSLASHYLDLYKINLFGNDAIISNVPYEYEGVFYYTVDMVYIFIPIIYGIVGTLIYASLYNITFRKLFKKEKYHHAILLILMLFYGIMEMGLYKYQFNTFMVLISYAVFAFEKDDEPSRISALSLSVFISLLIFVVLFRTTIMNNNSLFYIEGNTELYRQTQLLLGYYEKMHGIKFSAYDWTLGFGASIYTLIRDGLFSPFNLLLLLLKKEWVEYAIIYLCAIKLCFLSVTSSMWISKITKNRNIILTFSVVVTFSAIAILSWGTGFFDVYVFLPLVLYFVEVYIQKNKTLGFVETLLVVCLTNCVYSIPVGLFIAIYYMARESGKIKFDFLLIDLAIVGIVSFLTMPTLGFLNVDNDIDLISLFIPFNSCYSFGYILILSLMFFLVKDIKKIIKYILGFILSIIACIVLKKIFGFYVVFIPYLYLIVTLIEVLSLDNKNKDNFYLGLVGISDLLIIVDLFINENNEEIVSLKIGLLIVSIFACFEIKKELDKGISLLMVTSSLFIFYLFTYSSFGVNSIKLNTNNNSLTTISNSDSSLYRIIYDDGANKNTNKNTESYNLNYTYSDYGNQIPGVLINSNFYNNELGDFIRMYDSSSNNDYIGFEKNEISFNSIIGTKYWYSSDSERIPTNLYQKVDGTDYYINKYFIELGYINNKTINADYLNNLSTFEIEKVLREYVAINESDNTNYDLISNYNLTMLEDYTYDGYMEHEFEEPIDNVTLCINNGGMPVLDVEIYHSDGTMAITHFYQYDFCNIDIDQPTNKIVVKFDDVDENGYGIRLFICESNDNLEETIYNIRKENAFHNVSFNNDTINAQIDASENNSLVYTYVPYDTKWKIYVDGYEVQTIKANYGFIAFRVNSGTHNVEIKYEINTNTTISVCSGIGLAAILIIRTIIIKKHK